MQRGPPTTWRNRTHAQSHSHSRNGNGIALSAQAYTNFLWAWAAAAYLLWPNFQGGALAFGRTSSLLPSPPTPHSPLFLTFEKECTKRSVDWSRDKTSGRKSRSALLIAVFGRGPFAKRIQCRVLSAFLG
ncbi:hypothetical protein CEXT_538111 [Caerostris extrusa]|uniref:Uncharacterized protein n=1 Tax=Caerostris extrusa TaxID=172846 RepID=A0AAV4XMJ2_CAEEX|nr:hypothetical protein CEXT_538111 [Caerostris extrusa]